MKDESKIVLQVRARDKALDEAMPEESRSRLSMPERRAYTFGFMDGWKAGLEYQEQQAAAQARALEALRVAAEAVIEQVELDAATRSPYGLGATFNFYEASLTGEQVEALRAALQETTAYPAQGDNDDSELLDWLESQVQECLGGCPWYRATGEVHLRRASLREALQALRQAEEGGA